jgi:hypothetical protein
MAELFKAEVYRRGRGILYPDWIRTRIREVLGMKQDITISRNPLFLFGSGAKI